MRQREELNLSSGEGNFAGCGRGKRKCLLVLGIICEEVEISYKSLDLRHVGFRIERRRTLYLG